MLKGRVLITGSKGFLGAALVDTLVNGDPSIRERMASGAIEGILTPSRKELDLRDPNATLIYFYKHRPDVVFHLAATVGGIGFNRQFPGTIFYNNMMMGLNVLEAARRADASKVIVVGTVCSYPKTPVAPFVEGALWDGYPEETNAPYGIAKKALLVMGQAYHNEFGLDVVHLIPTNLYGPGDNFHPEHSHVIPAMIRTLVYAQYKKLDEVTFWGTGMATREFLYVYECARALVRAGEHQDVPGEPSFDNKPCNLGSGEEIRMRDLAALIAKIVGWEGKIRWDARQPDGQPRRLIYTARAEKILNWRAAIKLEDGLFETIKWYKQTEGYWE